MASDSNEPTRRKHHRASSPDDAEERSKRRKHRHHRRHRHHHRRSNKDKDETIETPLAEEELMEGERILETDAGEPKLVCSGDAGDVFISNGSDFAGLDYDMEEGEIVDDGLAGGNFDKLKNLDSDVESGEIKPNAYGDGSNMGLNDEVVERVDKKSLKLEINTVDGKKRVEMDQERASDSQGPANSNANQDDGGIPGTNHKRMSDSSDDVQRRAHRKSLSSETRNIPVSGPSSNDKFLKDNSHGKSFKSPEWSRGRSRSRSILQEPSTMGTPHKMEDPYYLEREHRGDSEDERMIGHGRNYRHSSRDYSRNKERERSSSRYSERTYQYYGRETHERYREISRERDGQRDRTREKSREREERERDRESARLRDRERSERERDRGVLTKEREREKDRERGKNRERESEKYRERNRDRHEIRMERNADRDRGKEGFRADVRARSRDKDMDRDNESDRFNRRQKHGNDNRNGERERENDSMHRRNSENYHRERSNRTDFVNLSSKGDHAERGNENPESEDEGQEDYQERISLQLVEKEDDLDKVKEESRRRKQAILEKYKNKQKNETQSEDMVKEKTGQLSEQVSGVEISVQKTNSQVEGADVYVAESSFIVGKSPPQNGLPTPERPTRTTGLGEGTPKSERSDDMFRDDIFGESPAGACKTGKEGAVAVERSGLNDNWDDAEGYYSYRFGEILDGRYEIIAAHGKGVFSTVVRAKDLKAKPGHPEEVAIKIIRNNETMYKAGMEELVILNKLVGADPENKRHCVRYLSNFKYRNHLCLVFESLHMNLREVLKKFGRNIGLKLTAVRTYAKQLFIALKHLKNCGVLHSDIKPDNMLVNEAKNVLKLCDFGNAMFSGKNEITPYLVSRFYRAPEIILGLPYDHPMDIWSVGCCLFEIYTGKVLFPGPTNNDMLRLHMELKGPLSKKMLRKGAFTDQHFDQDLNFLATEEDPVAKKVIRRLIVNIKPKDFGSLISGFPGEDPKMVSNFKDLMEKIFVLDPEKRLTVSQALSHPFITGK